MGRGEGGGRGEEGQGGGGEEEEGMVGWGPEEGKENGYQMKAFP